MPGTRPHCPLYARRPALVAALLWLATACASPVSSPDSDPTPARPTPSLWRASLPRVGDIFYLLGSVHYGTQQMVDLGSAVDRAFERCEELVLEVDLAELDSEEALQMVARYGVIPEPESLSDRVSADTYALLLDYLASRGVEAEPYLGLEPWFLAIRLLQLEFREHGFEPGLGVDRVFAERAARRMPVVALETGESQMRLFASLPDELQELMLVDQLMRSEDFEVETTDLFAAWERGDDAALEEILFRAQRDAPELEIFYERVMYQRNERMAEHLAELGRDQRLRFVVVGVAHMVGERGIPSLLGRRGFEIEKVR